MAVKAYGETAEAATRRTVEELRHAASYRAAIVRTLEKFAGKVYNKRFLEALRAATGNDRIYDDRRENLIHIYIYSGVGYSQYTIVSIPLTDKRIDTAAAIKNAGERYTAHTKKAAEIEEASHKISEYKRQLAELEALQRKIISGIPYELRDIYEIRTR